MKNYFPDMIAWQIVIDDPELARKVMVFKSLEEVDAETDDDANKRKI